ncbi:PaaX family transcriptional regulator C-terminal domain-containing protein [Paeniglutamicibacter sp. Y32M11]|uniref:PaaX family transcriptional regulator n=1 Tax=Paeniglutamicibacter sp. Y32M11 TaxID=2853258 RepID=UPI001C529557|nr:PaaX family transcriptional regulator C-terminal domain-containing protein [Paeniglutamicibacter sp. Y32M11]QXQ10962.1 regulator [Paeniglutamicibacter sp. Y32M11]
MLSELDDLDARPGSTTSLVRTIVGLYLREMGGWISSPHLISLMDTLGTTPQVTRTAISRLKKKGILDPQARGGESGFALTATGRGILARGDRRIFEPRSMASDDNWCILSYSIPEAQRERRHQLRKYLQGIGGGLMAPGLWIFPDYLREEVWEILRVLDLKNQATVVVSNTLEFTGTPQSMAAIWWDLQSLDSLHRSFLAQNGKAANASKSSPADSFATYVRAIDSWRTIPYLDPGLPLSFLPEDWPGRASSKLFLNIQSGHAAAARKYMESLTKRH